MNKVLEKQVGGNHYSKLKIQPAEFIAANNWDFLSGSVFKYVTRYKDKNGRQDIEKAIHFLELRDHLYSYDELDRLYEAHVSWISNSPKFKRELYSVADFVIANEFAVTDHRYKALMLLEELVFSHPAQVSELTKSLIVYLKFVIAIEYPERPIDN